MEEGNEQEDNNKQIVEETTEKELWGWYSYAWACEPFIVSAVGTYVPIFLEQLGRINGVNASDHSKPCITDHRDIGGGVEESGECVVPFLFGGFIDTSSLALYTFSMSVLVQTIVVISISGAADKGKTMRKKLLVTFGLIGGITTCFFLLVSSSRYYLASILAILSNSAFGAVSVCGNSYLPILVYNYKLPEIQEDEVQDQEQEQEQEELLQEHQRDQAESCSNKSREYRARARLSGNISGTGVAFGYLAAFIVQALTMFVIVNTGSTTFSLKLAIFVVGIWWIVFQAPIILFLKSHSSGTTKARKYKSIGDRLWIMYKYILYGWKTLLATFHEAREMKDVGIFLLGWFIISDAAVTVNSAAILFAKTKLKMSAPSLAVIAILVVCSGMAGAIIIPRFIQPWIENKFASESNARGKRLSNGPVYGLMAVILIASIIPLYGMLGFYFNVIGLKHAWEMYILAVWYGFALGGLNTTSRSVFSILIPKGKETTFFSLFSVTDKGSSIFGPFITGLITDRTHNIRYTFYFLFAMMVLAFVDFLFLDLERGRQEAVQLEHVEGEPEIAQ